MRLVEIAGVDVNACGGTHLASTAELQLLRVVGAERARGRVRLRVLLGGRALAALGRALPREAALSKVQTGSVHHFHAEVYCSLREHALTISRRCLAERGLAHAAWRRRALLREAALRKARTYTD